MQCLLCPLTSEIVMPPSASTALAMTVTERSHQALQLQMIAKAAQKMTRPSSGSDTYIHDLIPMLRSMAVPLELHKDSTTASPMQQAAAVPTFAEYTPRMVQLSLVDDAAQGTPKGLERTGAGHCFGPVAAFHLG